MTDINLAVWLVIVCTAGVILISAIFGIILAYTVPEKNYRLNKVSEVIFKIGTLITFLGILASIVLLSYISLMPIQ